MNVWTSWEEQKNPLPKHHWNKDKHNLLAQRVAGKLGGEINSSTFHTPILPTFSPVYTASKTISFHEPKARGLSGCCLGVLLQNSTHLNPLWLPTSELHVTHSLPNILCSSIKEWSGIWKSWNGNFIRSRILMMYIQLLTVLVVV